MQPGEGKEPAQPPPELAAIPHRYAASASRFIHALKAAEEVSFAPIPRLHPRGCVQSHLRINPSPAEKIEGHFLHGDRVRWRRRRQCRQGMLICATEKPLTTAHFPAEVLEVTGRLSKWRRLAA